MTRPVAEHGKAAAGYFPPSSIPERASLERYIRHARCPRRRRQRRTLALEVIDRELVSCYADEGDFDQGGRLAPEDEERLP